MKSYKCILFFFISLCLLSCKKNIEKTSGNPFVKGWYADPEAIVFGDEYWVYATLSDIYFPDNPDSVANYPVREPKTVHSVYTIQLYMDAFSSKDLVNWTKHPKVISVENVKWVEYAMWAPSIIAANGKYYIFFGGNDIQNDNECGGIGVAVSDSPAGPFIDALGKPLIDKFYNGAQPIDQFVYRDDDGQYYMYYGGWGHCNIVKLSDDLLSLVPFDDGNYYKEITPENFTEGAFVLKRNGKYYMMWSEGAWESEHYCVSYGIADTPLGPFKKMGKVLQSDKEIGTGAGHNSVINVPGTDEWYIFYHRHPLGDPNGFHREICVDRMYFDNDGKIMPIKMTNEGVKAVTINKENIIK